MKKLFLILSLCIAALIFCGYAEAQSNVIYKEGTTVTFYNESEHYTVDDVWKSGKYKAELYNGTLYVSIEDFKDAFKANIAYSYDDLTITMKLYDYEIRQTLWQDVLYVKDEPYPVPAPYISPAEGHPVMIALESFASTMGYKGTFEIKDTYLQGEMTLSVPLIPYTPTHIEVNQAAQLVTAYGKAPSGNIEPIRYMLCSTGVGNSTPNGTFKIKALGKDWYYFPIFNCYVRHCSQITGNVCFHSLTFGSVSNSSLSRSAYNKIGTKASHGCIRLFVEDAEFIHQNYNGLPVTISAGYTDTVTDGIRERIIANKMSYEDYVKSLK